MQKSYLNINVAMDKDAKLGVGRISSESFVQPTYKDSYWKYRMRNSNAR